MADELTSLYDDPQTPQQPRSVDATPNPDLDSLYSDKPSVTPQRTVAAPKPRNRDQHLQAIRAVNPEFADTAQRFIDFATGKGLTDVDIRSGYRTAAEQSYLNTHGYPTKGNDGYANISPHQQGRAIDWTTRNPANKQRLHDLMQIFVDKEFQRGNKLHIPSDEPWHMAGQRSRTAPDPGLNDLYGDDQGQGSGVGSRESVTQAPPALPPQPATQASASPAPQFDPGNGNFYFDDPRTKERVYRNSIDESYQELAKRGVNAPKVPGRALTGYDFAWHGGIDPDEMRNWPKALRDKASAVIAREARQDELKKAAGQPIERPPLSYQNDIRRRIGLEPISQPSARAQLLIDTAMSGIPKDARGRLLDVRPGMRSADLSSFGMEQRGGFTVPKETDVQRMLRTPVTDQDQSELARQQQARLQQAQHYGFNSNADYEQWIDKMSQGYGGANLRQSAEQEIGIRAGLLKQAQMTGQDAEDVRNQTHQLSSSLLSSLFDRSATTAASIVPGIWQVMGDLTDSESVRQLAVEGRKEINKRLIANRMAQGERGVVGRSTVGLSNLAGDVLVIAGLSRVVGPTKAMALYSGLSTLGQTGDYSEAGREGFKGALYGELFKMLPHIEPTQARTLTEKLVNLGVDAGAVATGTYAMERASGKNHDEALQSALTNSLLAGTFRLTDIIPAIPKAAAEKVLSSDSAPEWARRAAEWWTNYQQQAGTGAGTKGFDAAPRVEVAIRDIRQRGASPEAKAFFAGVEPRLAGTTISKVKQFADDLGIPWEPDPRWAAAESGETAATTSSPPETATVAGEKIQAEFDDLYPPRAVQSAELPQQPAGTTLPTEAAQLPTVRETTASTPVELGVRGKGVEGREPSRLTQLAELHRSGAVDKYIAEGGKPDVEAIQQHFNASYGQALDIVDYMNDPARRPSPTLATDSIGRVAESGDSSDRRAGVAAASDTAVSPDEAAGSQAIPTPEKPETIREQLDALYAGRRNAVLITPGEKMHPPRKGYGTVKTAVGTFIYDKNKLAPYDSPRNKKPGIMDAVNNGTYHKLLGIVEPKSPETTRIVTARTPEGVEAQSAVVSPEREPEQVAEFQQAYPESDIETGGTQQMQRVVDERARLNATILERARDFQGEVATDIGSVGGLLQDVRELRQFRAIANVPIIVDPALTRPAETRFLNRNPEQIKAGAPAAEIRIRAGASPVSLEELLYHEMIHADRGAKGRTVTKGAEWPHPEEHRALVGGRVLATRATEQSEQNINPDLDSLYDAEPLSTEGQQRTLEENGEPQSQRESGVGSQESAGGTEAGAVGSGSTGAVGGVGEAARVPDQGRSDRVPEPSGGAGKDALREPDQRPEDGTSSSGGDREERIPQPGPAGLPLGQSALEQQTVKASRNQPRNALLERDYRIDPEKLDFGGKKEKFRLNVAAIQTLKQIEAEGRSYATPEEQEKLVRYVGWGGLPEVFNRWQTDAKWKKEHDQIVRLLGGYDSEEYGRAMDSTKNAHFTSPEVVGAIWQMVKRLGFEGGRTLEPALGTGNFLGMMPPEIHGNPATTMKGIELDPLTGRIAQLLYPSASINIQSFQDYDIADNYYDLVTSNVPFSETTQIADKRYAHLRTMLHDYFFVKSLDKVRPGGLIAFITSTGTMDRQRSDIRKAIAEKADLVAAFRLPDTAFKKNAGTEVTTDLLILRKHTSQKPIPVGGGAQQLNFKHADELTTAERYADEEPSHAWFRIQDATKPLPDRSTNWWTGSQDEHPFMDGVSAFINLETASRDLLGGDDVDGLGVNYAEGINEHGGSAILSIFAGTDQGDESPNVNGFSVFDEPNTEVRFSPEEVLAAWKTALLKEYPEDSKDVEEMDWDDLREAYNLSDFDVDAFHALRSVANERKRGLADNKWVDTKTMKLGGRNLQVNEYYHEHPENMLGTATASIKMYGPGDSGENARFALRGTDDFPERLETAIESLPQGVYRPFTGDRSEEIRFPAPEEIKQGAWLVRDGKLFRKHSGELVQQDATADRIARVEAMIPVRQAIRELFLTELGKTKAEVSVSRERLNEAYDSFVEKHGPLNSKANIKAFAGDPDGPMLLKLERPTKEGKYNKADIFRKSVVKTYDKPTKADSVNDAVGISLNETARLDLNRMGELLSKTPDQIEEELIAADLGYRDPLDGWVVKDEYLSGNLKKKLLTATEAAKTDDLYKRNVDALTQSIKEKLPDVDYVDIDARIGANWIPADDLKQFAAELMQISPKNFQIHYLPSSGTWVADSDHGATYNGPQAQTVWGTKRAPFMRILQAALDNKNIAIYDKSGDASVLNKDATEAANAKVKELKEQFKDWVWQDDERRTRLHRYYNDNFNNIVNRAFDGQHLTLPGLSPEWQAKLRPHVKDAVWRVISTGKMLGGHEVGTGKTAVMVISSMELKRLGLARKSMIGGLNSTISGLAKEAREMYPNINLLVLGEKDIDAKQRNLLMADIASSDYDLVIMGHSHIDMLPVLPETQAKYIREEMNELEAALTAIEEDAHESGPANESNADRVKRRKKSRNAVVKQLAKAKEKLEEKLKAALASKRDNVVYFEQTGIDNIAIDEAHKYKAVPVYTKRGSVKGIPTSRSDRATNMLMLTRWLQEQNRNRGVSLYSGTLISNALTEVYTLQRFVQWTELKERGIEAFDAWANLFGETTTKLEYTTTGEYKQVTRFNHFTNLPELRRLLGQVMDIRFASDLPGFKRPERKDEVVSVPMSDAQWDYLVNEIRPRAELVKKQGGKAEKGQDNMLSISTDARKSAMDMRLVRPTAYDDPGSKVNEAIAKILRNYQEQPGQTQMLFSDYGINPTEWGFSLAQDIIKKLVKGGIPRDEIINFNELTRSQRGPAIRALDTAKARVAIGSTEKMGTGINAQTHLRDLHHIDAPWLPAYVEQRNGRGWRPGNENETVNINTFTTAKSFDTFMWQTVANKQRFIDQFMRGDESLRSIRDDDTDELSFGQIMAVTSGNPELLFKMQLEDEVNELSRASRRHENQQLQFKDTIKWRQQNITNERKAIKEYTADAATYEKHKDEPFSITIGDKTFKVAEKAKPEDVATVKAKAGKHLKERADAIYAEYKDAGHYRREELEREGESDFGTYRGFTVQFKPRTGNLYLARERDYSISWGEDELTALRSMDAVLRQQPGNRMRGAENYIAQYEREMKQAEAQLGKPFRDADKLTKKREELAAVTARLEASTPEVQEAEAADATETNTAMATDAEAGGEIPEEGGQGSGVRGQGEKPGAAAKASGERRPTTPKKATQPAGKKTFGPGASTRGELSRPSIGDMIDPSLRAPMAQQTKGASEQSPTVSLLNALTQPIRKAAGAAATHGATAASTLATGDVMNQLRGWLHTLAGHSMPKTTLRDRVAGELGARYAASRAAAGPMADLFANDVLTGIDIDQAKFDALLKADNLLSIKDDFEKAGETENADKVNTLFGEPDFPFATEEEMVEYGQTPEVQEALARHIENWDAVINPMYREAAGIDPDLELPARGKNFGARVNLNPIVEGVYEPDNGTVVGPKHAGGGPGGYLLGTLQRKTPFARKAYGTGQRYLLNYAETIGNTFWKQLEIANKRAFDDALVNSGNAEVHQVGKRVVLPDGEPTKAYPYRRKGMTIPGQEEGSTQGITQQHNIYIRESLAKEYAHAADIILDPYRGNMLVSFNKLMAKIALTGLTDATVHISNLSTVLMQVPGTTGLPLLPEAILSALGRLDIPVTAARTLIKAWPEMMTRTITPSLLKNMTQMASLTEINAGRPKHENRGLIGKRLGIAIQGMDRVTRMVMDDSYRNLNRQGLVKDNETQRREFINQVGSYNLRTQGEWMRFLRQTWTSPFVTAGRTFATLGIRGVTLNPGVEASSMAAAAAMRGSMAAKWIGTLVLVGLLNYLINRKLMGRPGTPIGAVDTGMNDKNGNPLYINVMNLTGQTRALRTVGARGAIQAWRRGLPASDIAGAAARDITNTAAGPIFGPGPRFAFEAATGYQPAVGVPRQSETVAPGESQAWENLRSAAMQANPLLASVEEYRKPGGSIAKAVERQLPRFTLTPVTPAQSTEQYPELVQRAQAREFTDWIVHNARAVPMADRKKWVDEQVNRLPETLQGEAQKEVMSRGVFAVRSPTTNRFYAMLITAERKHDDARMRPDKYQESDDERAARMQLQDANKAIHDLEKDAVDAETPAKRQEFYKQIDEIAERALSGEAVKRVKPVNPDRQQMQQERQKSRRLERWLP